MMTGLSDAGQDAGLHVLGPLEQVPVGEGRAFGVAGEQVAVFRLRDGSLRAVSAVCPHKGGPDRRRHHRPVRGDVPAAPARLRAGDGLLHHRRRAAAQLSRSRRRSGNIVLQLP